MRMILKMLNIFIILILSLKMGTYFDPFIFGNTLVYFDSNSESLLKLGIINSSNDSPDNVNVNFNSDSQSSIDDTNDNIPPVERVLHENINSMIDICESYMPQHSEFAALSSDHRTEVDHLLTKVGDYLSERDGQGPSDDILATAYREGTIANETPLDTIVDCLDTLKTDLDKNN